jgi:tetratricopeptide (TPR) repeat protein
MPGTPQILLGLADLALEKGDPARARSFAQAAAAVGAAGASEVLAEAALAGKDYEGARREVRALLARDDRSRTGWILLASVEKEAGNLPAALEALERVRRLSEDSGEPLPGSYGFLRGDVLARMGKTAEAEAAFREETRAFPDNPAGWTGLALLLASDGRSQDAARTLEEMIAKSPQSRSYFAAARTWEVLGDLTSAARLRKRARDLFPEAREAADPAPVVKKGPRPAA